MADKRLWLSGGAEVQLDGAVTSSSPSQFSEKNHDVLAIEHSHKPRGNKVRERSRTTTWSWRFSFRRLLGI